MPIVPPVLDDRGFDDLVAEALSRIPAHTPEWTNPRLGDPGRTLVELFAWLTDTLLYRANQIPVRQRLTFLGLLGIPMRAAVAARGLVTLAFDDPAQTGAVSLQPHAEVKGPVPFETRSEITVLPVQAQAFYKRALDEEEREEMAAVIDGLRELYRLGEEPVPYVTTPVFPGGAADPAGFDLVQRSVDGTLWLALLASAPEHRDAVRATLGGEGVQRILNVGVAPAIEVPGVTEEIGPRAGVPVVWEMSTGREVDGQPEYLTLDALEESREGGTRRLTRRGVVRLVLPATSDIGAPPNDVGASLDAGVGDRPPRLDAPEQADRLVAWLRLRPSVRMQSLSLSWIGVNAVEIDQRRTLANRVVGQSNGAADQIMQLPATSVEADSLQIQVEEAGAGYRPWRRVDDLATAGRGDPVFVLDSEAGTIRFGDGVRGRVPEPGRRVRVATLRAGGGRAGNLPPGSLSAISALDLGGAPVRRLKLAQALATEGGEDAETLEQAERRIPEIFRHRDRAVTRDDYRQLAAGTPGVRLGRVEVLPRFKPQQRRANVPGAVSVLVLPYKEMHQPPNPRPDRPTLEAVHAHLDARRPLTTEMYVIGCEYVPLGVGASLTVREGSGRDTVLRAVREALRDHLWSLPPGGVEGGGWPLGQAVRDRELEVVIARVPGVSTVVGVNLFERRTEGWRLIPRPQPTAPVELALQAWQLPELLSLVVLGDGGTPPTDLRGAPNPFAGGPGGGGMAVPVVPEVC